uniref:Uncharacterized protein n=1 Tax=Caenorhabditis japonica TaxID=281687 RepID=A0A8R1IB90_CAEJA
MLKSFHCAQCPIAENTDSPSGVITTNSPEPTTSFNLCNCAAVPRDFNIEQKLLNESDTNQYLQFGSDGIIVENRIYGDLCYEQILFPFNDNPYSEREPSFLIAYFKYENETVSRPYFEKLNRILLQFEQYTSFYCEPRSKLLKEDYNDDTVVSIGAVLYYL